VITESELTAAIAECKSQKHPDASTCAKLASYYIILDHMKSGARTNAQHSYDAPAVRYISRSEFGQLIGRLPIDGVMQVMDELMETIKVKEPRLYSAVMDKLTAL